MVDRQSSLADAVEAHVRPGMHLHFASLPFRSNSAIREVARQFLDREPGFTVSATGFHSTAHLFGLLGLASRYISCFYGDNYPTPRPSRLYGRLEAEGAVLEQWSLLSLVTALRAGALGLPFGVTRSLVGSSLGEALEALGRVRFADDPFGSGQAVALVRPIRPDLTFVHGHLGDAAGNVVVGAPACEGPWGALAATGGVIATVERVVPSLAEHPDRVPIPPHRVRAVCETPGGAHPQPLVPVPGTALRGYPDAFDHYALWRRMCADPELFRQFREEVLRADDGERAYRRYLTRPVEPAPPAAPSPDELRLILLAARRIRARVEQGGHDVILAGIGHSFLACRVARALLEAEGVEVRVVVEIGLYDLDCSPDANRFLLAWDHAERARRLSSVEDALGAVTCGAGNRALGVLGAAQVDGSGAVNSTRLGDRLLVGSGGANDIASAADEVMVVVRGLPGRLVQQVDHVTSPGHRVRSVVTDVGVLSRSSPGDGWSASDLGPGGMEALRAVCPWPLTGEPTEASPLTDRERALLAAIDPGALQALLRTSQPGTGDA